MTKKAKKPSAKADKRMKILHAVLAEVPFEGWTETAYASALTKTKTSRKEADTLFPDGLIDVVNAFGKENDAAMQKAIESNRNYARLRVRDKIAQAVRIRIEAMAPHREAVRRLMIWYAIPTHVPLAMKRIYKTIDTIWNAAGDTSTDYNFYTKRILLAGVWKTTLLFWLGDDTPGYQSTWEFLDRRIVEVVKLGKGISLMKEYSPADIADKLRNAIKKYI